MFRPLGVIGRKQISRYPAILSLLLRVAFMRFAAPGGAAGRGTTGHRATGPSPLSCRSHSDVVRRALAITSIVSYWGCFVTSQHSLWMVALARPKRASSARHAGGSPRSSRGRHCHANHTRWPTVG